MYIYIVVSSSSLSLNPLVHFFILVLRKSTPLIPVFSSYYFPSYFFLFIFRHYFFLLPILSSGWFFSSPTDYLWTSCWGFFSLFLFLWYLASKLAHLAHCPSKTSMKKRLEDRREMESRREKLGRQEGILRDSVNFFFFWLLRVINYCHEMIKKNNLCKRVREKSWSFWCKK